MTPKEILEYYSRADVQDEIIRLAKDKEVVGVFRNGSYGQRPNTLVYPQDITALTRSGIVEFHCSVEYWKNPILLKENYDEMRKGFDIIFDIDCKDFEFGKIAASVFIHVLEKHGIKNYSIKFSGGKGFHIGVPWSAMPKEVNYKPIEKLYPELPRAIIEYLKNTARDELAKAMLKRWKPEELAEKANVKIGELITEKGIEPYKLVDIDPLLVSPRHLFRMPYSLNRNTFLASLPIKPAKIEGFKKTDAEPNKIVVKEKFLFAAERNEAELLIAEAMDWKTHRKEEKPKVAIRKITRAVPLDFAPPCIKLILNGMSDGKKRSLFILLNYLSSVKWEKGNIENTVVEWNKKNTPGLKDNYVRSQLRYNVHREKAILPPNCNAKGYYQDIGVCKPDEICTGHGKEIVIKNPVNYPFRKMGKKREK